MIGRSQVWLLPCPPMYCSVYAISQLFVLTKINKYIYIDRIQKKHGMQIVETSSVGLFPKLLL